MNSKLFIVRLDFYVSAADLEDAALAAFYAMRSQKKIIGYRRLKVKEIEQETKERTLCDGSCGA